MQRLGDGVWEKPGLGGIREVAVTWLEMTYIWMRQETVVQWLALRPLFDFCAGGKWYKGGGGGGT